MFVYVNGKEAEIGSTRSRTNSAVVGAAWARRRNNIDLYLDAVDTASRFIWGKVKDAHDVHQARKAGQSFQYLDPRTLSDIGMSRTDATFVTCGPKPALDRRCENKSPNARRLTESRFLRVKMPFDVNLFDGALS